MRLRSDGSHTPVPLRFRLPNPSTLRLLLSAGVIIFYAAATVRRGAVLSSDSQTYSAWADSLLQARFNYISWLRETSFVVPPVTYVAWVSIVALAKLAFHGHWAAALVGYNLVLASAAVIVLLWLVEALTKRRLATAFAAALLVLAFEVFLWIPYVLSDTSSAVLDFAIFALMLGWASASPLSGRRREYLACIALTLLALFYRPSGLVVLAFVALTSAIVALVRRELSTAAFGRWFLVSLAAATAALVVLDATVVMNPTSWPVPFATAWIHSVHNQYASGWVIQSRPETWHHHVRSFWDFVSLTLDKLRYYFVFVVPGFSRTHKLVNVLFFVPAYGGSLVALWRLLVERKRSVEQGWIATWVATLFIALFAVFYSLQLLDYDWRYRLPCLMPLVVLSCIGFFPRRDATTELIGSRHPETARA